jgi:hypothetical protein
VATTGDNVLDNVEQIYVPAPGVPGAYDIGIDCERVIYDGEGHYSLISSIQLFDQKPPTAEGAQIYAQMDAPLTVDLVATDDGFPDPPGRLTYVIASLPSHGALEYPDGAPITEPTALADYGNQVVYRPDNGFMGEDHFTFYVDDGGSSPSGGISNTATVTALVRELVVREYQVSADEDDAYADRGFQSVHYKVLWLGTFSCGMRFSDVDISGANTVLSARLKLFWDSGHCVKNDTINAAIYAEATGNAADFVGDDRFVDELPRTEASAPWSWEVGTCWENRWYTSPDISDVVQEVFDRQDWSEGNAIVIIYLGDVHNRDRTCFLSHYRSPGYAAKLEITYTLRPYTISGYVRTPGGSAISGVTLSADNDGGSATTDSSGYYCVAVRNGWSGRVTPSKMGYVFDAVSRSYENVMSNHTRQDYTGLLPYTVTPSAAAHGTISPSSPFGVGPGFDQKLTANPDSGYEVDTWYLDGVAVQTGGTTYTLQDVQSDHEVHVTFKMQSISFADPNLKAAVENALGVSDPTLADMLALTDLQAEAGGITCLGGLEHAVNLQSVSLAENHISDISVLAELTNLTTLSLQYNQISDISGLIHRSNLAWLDLSANPLNQDAYNIYLLQILENNPNLGNQLYFDAVKVIYVDDDAPADGDGTSWESAHAFLQDALDEATSAHCSVVVRVAQGTYEPDRAVGNPDGSRDRNASFHITNGVAVEGGYAGMWAADPDGRNIDAFETILCGDLNRDDTPESASTQENCYHVVTVADVISWAILDGVTVTGGCANGTDPNEPNACGGGMYILRSNPELIHCTLKHNSARFGGAMYNRGSSPTLVNCTFLQNQAVMGGGICSVSHSSLSLDRCTLVDNSAAGSGGATTCLDDSDVTLSDCTVAGNDANDGGGGLYSEGSGLALTDCLLTGNSAGWGGALALGADGRASLRNSTLAANSADQGSALACTSEHVNGPDREDHTSEIQVTSCILWDGVPEQGDVWNDDGSRVTMTYSYVQYMEGHEDPIVDRYGQVECSDDTNIKTEQAPDFADSESSNYRLLPGSACIDCGDPNHVAGPERLDLDVNSGPRVIGGRIDIGACEFVPGQFADLNEDGFAGSTDYAIFADNWLKDGCVDPSWCEGSDIDWDGMVTIVDLIAFVEHWLTEQPRGPLPVAHWALDETDGTTAYDSAGANHGTVYGATWTTGQIDGGLSFDGRDDYVDCGSSEMLSPQTMTLAFWVQPQGDVSYQYILGKAVDIGPSCDYRVSTGSSGKPEFRFGEGMGMAITVRSSSELAADQWSHVTVVRDGSAASLYLNGELENSASYSFTYTHKGHTLRIGSIGTDDGWAGYYKGKIDDVRIYDLALTADDVAALAALE